MKVEKMDARCIICSNKIKFRSYRGARLCDIKCDCGGSLEAMYFDTCERGISPLGKENSYLREECWLPIEKHGLYFDIYKSKTGKFVLNKIDKKFLPYKKLAIK